MFHVQFARRPLNPLLRAERSASGDAHTQTLKLPGAQRRIHVLDPIHGAVNRPWRRDRIDRIFAMDASPKSAPTPRLGPSDSSGTDRIALDLPQDRQQMIVALNRKTLWNASKSPSFRKSRIVPTERFRTW